MDEPISMRAGDLASTYAPVPGAYDELKHAGGELRPHWQPFFDHLTRLGPTEIDRRWQKAQHLLHENGVSYNVYGDPRGMDRPWDLSPLPVLLPAADWSVIASGLAQRARLLDALLRDLYGPQRVLLEGLLPAELVFENPCFLRACHRLPVPRDRRLPLYCADVVRTPDGGFAVLEDRTQAPSGAGYALENRIVISSVLPDAFRECKVERLALFFRALRELLHSLAPHNRDNPRIVLLTPGPHTATHFEQAYLAQYLGYSLVTGGDLTVRDDHVYIKTLGGLQPVDVILRRVNDDFCDPLELRPESLLGVPGLVHAARTGNVAIANPLGSGLLQTPALLSYLPRLCRLLLGEDLQLPSVRSLWCGEPAALQQAEARFDDIVVKPTYPQGFVGPIHTASLSQASRAELLAKIHDDPRAYIIQDPMHASTTPALADGTITARALVMRCFAVAERDGYVVMPGALSRVAGDAQGTEASMQLGAGSKDTWVLARDSVTTFSLLPPVNKPVELSRGGSDLPSRATDNLYWLGRYAERAESVARLTRTVCGRAVDLVNRGDLERSRELGWLVRALDAQTSLRVATDLPAATAITPELAQRELFSSVFDAQRAGGLLSVVTSALRAGRLVRDRISTDTWRVLAALDDELGEAQSSVARVSGDPLGSLHDALGRVVLRLAAFSGMVMESMTRGHAWRFLDMGRRLERALSLVTLLRATLTERDASAGDAPLLEAVLEIADSGMTYRRRYLATLQTAPVVDLLLTDETNPRSVLFQMNALMLHLEALPAAGTGLRTPQERIALGILTDLELLDVERACALDGQTERVRLTQLLLDLGQRIPTLSDSLSDRYLNHATVSRHLTSDEASTGTRAFPESSPFQRPPAGDER